MLIILRTRRGIDSRDYPPEEAERDAERVLRGMETRRRHLDPDLTLDSLARKAGIGRNRLSALLNARFKKNFNDFVNEYRVAEAKRLLRDPSRTVLDACFEAGFNSKATFYAAFKRFQGTIPGEYARERAEISE